MRLLLAEDEKALSRALVAILERNHYSVDAVYDGRDALTYLEADNYDGAILDIMMPGMDGITVLQTIRAKGNCIPVLMLTAKSEVEDKVHGLDAGANDYLTKPFHTQELLARIRAMTRTQAAQPDSLRMWKPSGILSPCWPTRKPGRWFNGCYWAMARLPARPSSCPPPLAASAWPTKNIRCSNC